MSYVVKFPALRIERRFADAILDGRKVWEFRKRPLDIGQTYLLCVREECDRVVGAVTFSFVVGAFRGLILNTIRRGDFRPWAKWTGLPKGWLESYAKDYEPVWAHLVESSARFEPPAFGTFRNGVLAFETANRDLAVSVRDRVERLERVNSVSRFDLYLRRTASTALADAKKAKSKEAANA